MTLCISNTVNNCVIGLSKLNSNPTAHTYIYMRAIYIYINCMVQLQNNNIYVLLLTKIFAKIEVILSVCIYLIQQSNHRTPTESKKARSEVQNNAKMFSCKFERVSIQIKLTVGNKIHVL